MTDWKKDTAWEEFTATTNEIEKIDTYVDALDMEVSYNHFSDGGYASLAIKLKDHKKAGIDLSPYLIPIGNILTINLENKFKGPRYSKNPYWYESLGVENEEIQFGSILQFIEYRKAIMFFDFSLAEKILKTNEPNQILNLSQSIERFSPNTWMHKCIEICWEAFDLISKQSKAWRKELLSKRGRLFVEKNEILFWGTKENEYDINNALNLSLWPKHNVYGILLALYSIENEIS
ncbi:MAG: NADAR family protein [Bacteroidia bacterium]|nr:NADAR family protein [Bacteroidia bacterium]